MTSVHRVLVVEDHEPFRQVIRELLDHRTDVRIIGEAADGLDAIHQAVALRPDVVMLDIGLPTLSGIDVADRIHAVLPDAKLMFVTNESSLEVAESVFARGAHGYVYKPRAHRDVVPVFEAVVRGGRFVSGGLERIARGDSLACHCHRLLFCSDDAVLVGAFTRFLGDILRAGAAAMAIVTESRARRLEHSLHASQIDLDLAIRHERYIRVDVSAVLADVMVDGWPDAARFQDATGDLLTAAVRRHGRVAAVGECCPVVWGRGELAAAIQLEHLVDETAKRHQMDSLCAYPLTAREQSLQAVRSLCAEHTSVEIS